MNVSLVPRTDDVDVYLVLDELRTGRVWREIEEELANEVAVINWIADGQFDHPLRVVAFNSAEGWSKDVTEDIARKLLDLSCEGRMIGSAAVDFIERVTQRSPMVAV